MTPEQTRQLLLDVLAAHTAEINGKFDVINEKLDNIEVQTKRTNGRVTKLEEKTSVLEINDLTHINECPNVARIQRLENTDLEKKSIFRFITVVFGVCATVATIVIAYFEMKK